MPAMYPALWSSAAIGSRTATNRFLAQPMEGNDGENGGRPSERTMKRYEALGRGKWGIVVAEAISVVHDCRARVNQMVLTEENLDSFKVLVDRFKKANPQGILLFQITHSGRKGSAPGTTPTALYPKGAPANARLLSAAEVEEIRRKFVEASLMAEKAGADGIDFKMCHGYLGAEMLRPGNDRDDEWGGPFERRLGFLTKSIPEIRSRAKRAEFIIGARVSMYEGIRGGCGTADKDEVVEDLGEMRRVLRTMTDLGMDYINVSAGIPGETSEITRPVPQGRWFYLHHVRYAKTAMETVAAPLPPSRTRPRIIQSGFSILKGDALALAEECISKGYSDFAGFGRQIFADPETPAKLLRGEEPNWCIGCSGCTKLMIKQVNDGCSVYDEYYKSLMKIQGGA